MKQIIIYVLIFSMMILSIACDKQDNEISFVSNHESSDSSAFATTSAIEGEKELKLTVCRSADYLVAIHEDHFFATDENNQIYKLHYEGDLSILSSGLEIYVRISNINSIEFNQPILNQWVYQYEATVEYLGLIERPY